MLAQYAVQSSGSQPIALYIVIGVVLVGVIWFVATYNILVRLRQQVAESWSGIDTELKRRYDLIPNLVETVKGYAKHEREVFERVIAARNQAANSHGSPKEQATDENAFIGSMKQLFAVAENYPDLKANQNFLQLQQELSNTEDRIQAARRFYNANVRDLNTRCQVLPSNIVAGMFNFKQAEFFEIEDASMRAVPKMSF
ncbi:MAG: LemA family protein [Planctomycetes bacterium]|nr:LemA family protein [Planctomycetota bacterium]